MMTIDQEHDMIRQIVDGLMCELNVKQKLDMLVQCTVAVINSPDEEVNSCAQANLRRAT